LGYDPTDRRKVSTYLDRHQDQGEVLTGLLYLDESAGDMHELSQTSEVPLVNIPFETLCPGSKALEELQEEFR
jgi:2-oxoglutarate ferredoxin oxidoreductase subunit beta